MTLTAYGSLSMQVGLWVLLLSLQATWCYRIGRYRSVTTNLLIDSTLVIWLTWKKARTTSAFLSALPIKWGYFVISKLFDWLWLRDAKDQDLRYQETKAKTEETKADIQAATKRLFERLDENST